MDQFSMCMVFAALAICGLSLFVVFQRGVQNRREKAEKVETALLKLGLSTIPRLLGDYSRGAYVKLAVDLDHAAETLLDPMKAVAEFATLWANMATIQLNNPATSAVIAKQFATLAKAAGVTIPTV